MNRGAGASPVLTFQCGTGRCELVWIWTGARNVLCFPHRSLGEDEQASLKTVRLISAAD